ncbi:MAG: HD domain-containing protein [Planctomycetes bacterium]|nr:HD domain-containing protein [Planctomycetota bacterium]
MGGAAVAEEVRTSYAPVPLLGLAGREPLRFPVFLRTSATTWVLYKDVATAVNEEHLGRLQAEGCHELYIRESDRAAYYQRIEGELDGILKDKNTPLERRADVLHGVALAAAEDLLGKRPDAERIARTKKVMIATSGLLLREQQGFQAVRRVLGASKGLVTHSLTVSFLAMGLARHVLSAEANVLLLAGMSGMLHDVGKVGYEQLDHDPEHTQRGAQILASLGVPGPVIDAAAAHHERHDGSGFPHGLRGAQIPEMARLVGLVDAFDKVYSTQQPRVGVFDALRILAQAYRGCFDERLALGFIKLFKA